jgi:hypothetical protein
VNEERIRHVACPLDDDDLFATAEFERTVSVWSLARRRTIVKFDTGLDFGGRRLAITAKPEAIVFVGAYLVHGICGYTASHGRLLWQRKDLKKVQYVEPLPNDRVAAGFDEGRSLHVLDSLTGETAAKLRGLRMLRTSPDSPFALGAAHSGSRWIALYELASGRRLWRQATTSFAILDAAIGPTSVLVGEVGGPVRCFDLQGAEVWRWDPPAGEHIIRACWSPTTASWVAVLMPYERGGSMRSVLGLDEKGAMSFAFEVADATEAAFLDRGRFLVTSGGHVVEIPSGGVAWDFRAEPGS